MKTKLYIGSSTAAHQVEGNNLFSDYYAMEHMKYTDFVCPSNEACDHYNRYKEDIKMMAEAKLNAYRFSIEWARIEKNEGEFDENELKHYEDVIDTCYKYGIEPIVTLYHFTSPKWLITKGGWENPEVVNYFARYTKKVVEYLGSKIHYICTLNEANMGIQVAAIAKRYRMLAERNASKNVEGQAQIGMNFNTMMENMKKKAMENVSVFNTPNPQTFVSARTKEGDLLVCKAHVEASKVIKEINPNIKVGITLSLHDIQPINKEAEARALEEWNDEFTHYLPFIKNDDFFGLQNYSRSIIGVEGQLPNPEGAKVTQMGYENYPEALEHVIRRVNKELGLPIMITENGIATSDDKERVEFIQKAMQGVINCINDGINVLGYLHWSFIDNFEWQKGFSMQFGLVSVDRETQKRTPKESLYVLGNYSESL